MRWVGGLPLVLLWHAALPLWVLEGGCILFPSCLWRYGLRIVAGFWCGRLNGSHWMRRGKIKGGGHV